MESAADEQRPIRVGAVAYLNARPLVWCLARLAPHVPREVVQLRPQAQAREAG